jgi:hypothetical protein
MLDFDTVGGWIEDHFPRLLAGVDYRPVGCEITGISGSITFCTHEIPSFLEMRMKNQHYPLNATSYIATMLVSLIGAGQLQAQEPASKPDETVAPMESTAELPPPTTNKKKGDWEFVVAPYFVLPTITGDQSVGRVDGVDLDVSPHDILENLNFGAMADLEVRKDGIGAVVNASYMGLGGDEHGPLGGKLDWDTDQWTISSYLTYRIPNDKGFIEPYIGARYWSIEMSMDLKGGLIETSKSDTEEWVDIFGGLRLKHELNDKWSLLAQGDIGGFGWTSKFTWYALAGVSYDLNEHCSIVAAFTAIGVDYEDGDKGTSDYFEYDTITYGPLIGMIFRF